MNLAICIECGEQITEKDEMLPDYEGLYQCPRCGHPNGRCNDLFRNHKRIGRFSSIKGFMPLKDDK